MGSAQEVLAEYFETAFDEAHFLVNLHSFFPGNASPQVSHLYVRHPPSKNNFQNSPRLDTSATALVYICYS